MKTNNLLHFNFAQASFVFCMLLLCSVNTFAGYHVKDKKPNLDYDDTETNRRFGNLNFYVDYNLANDRSSINLPIIDDATSYLEPGQMGFTFIIRENNGGGGIYDAWLKYGNIYYKTEEDNDWQDLGKVYRKNDLNTIQEVNYDFANEFPGYDLYGLHKTEKINSNLGWYAGMIQSYVNNMKYIVDDEHNTCTSMRLILGKIPESWYGKKVKIKFEGYWERNAATSDEGIFSNAQDIVIDIPTADVTDCAPEAENNSCGGEIPFSFNTPSGLTETHSSFRNDKNNIYLRDKKFKIKYRQSGTETWVQLNDENFGELDEHTWYSYSVDGEEYSTKLQNISAGKEYEFQVMFKYMPVESNAYYSFGGVTNIVKGSTMAPPVIPVIDSLVPGCNAATLFFHAAGDDIRNINHFKIYRDISFSYITFTGTVQSNYLQNITDNIPENSVQYNYSMESFKTL